MNSLLIWLRSFVDEEDAPTFLEYSLMVIVIALVVVAAATLFGSAVTSFFAAPSGVV